MLALLAASQILITPLPGGYYTATVHNVPVIQPSLPAATRMLQNAAIGNPAIRGEYQFPDAGNGYPLQTTRYGQPMIPIQEQLQTQQVQTDLQHDQLQVTGMQLNQVLAQKQDQYQTNINNQALSATQQLGQFDPASPDFDSRFTEFQKNNPLAFQNPGFSRLASQLIQTRHQYLKTEELNAAANQSIQARAEAAQLRHQESEAAYQQRVLNDHRSKAAEYGLASDYDAALKENPNDPIAAYSAIAPRIMEQKSQAKQDDIKNRPLTPEGYNALELRNRSILKAPDGSVRPVASLTPEELQDYAFNRSRMEDYQKQHPVSPDAAAPAVLAAPQIKEGATATNKTTGQKVVFKNGAWTPVP